MEDPLAKSLSSQAVGDQGTPNGLHRPNSSDGSERCSKKNSDRTRRGRCNLDSYQVTDTQDYRIFAATWNVGGKSPPSHLNLEDWLHSSPPTDIYVLGFQEIVPLNAGNVLGTEDNGPARKWVSLFRRTINNLPGTNGNVSYHTPSPVPNPIVELDDDFEGSSTRQKNSSFFHRRSFQSLSWSMRFDGDMMMPQAMLDRRFSVCDRIMFGSRPSDYDPNYRWNGSSDDENIGGDSPSTAYHSPMSYGYGIPAAIQEKERSKGNSRYCLVASKQMVGIFLSVWVRNEIRDDVKNLKVSCVGRGLISLSWKQVGYCSLYGKKLDPEPGRCHRTDGKKWRCSKDAYPDSKYCDRHMHRGRNRSRKPVETTTTTTHQSSSSSYSSPSSSSTLTALNSISATTTTNPTSGTFQNFPIHAISGIHGTGSSSQLHMGTGFYGMANRGDHRFCFVAQRLGGLHSCGSWKQTGTSIQIQ